MRVLADGDLFLEFFANRKGRVEAAEKLLEMVQSQQIEMYVTDQCLDKLRFYLSKGDDQFGEDTISKIEAMLKDYILPISQNLIQEALTYPLPDFESAVEMVCATAMNLDAIITQNQHNFAGATLPVWSVDELLKQQLVEILEQQEYTESESEWSELHLKRVRRCLERSTQIQQRRWMERQMERLSDLLIKWVFLEHIDLLEHVQSDALDDELFAIEANFSKALFQSDALDALKDMIHEWLVAKPKQVNRLITIADVVRANMTKLKRCGVKNLEAIAKREVLPTLGDFAIIASTLSIPNDEQKMIWQETFRSLHV